MAVHWVTPYQQNFMEGKLYSCTNTILPDEEVYNTSNAATVYKGTH